MYSILLQTKELMTYYCGCHGNLVTIAVRYVADAIANMDSIRLKINELLMFYSGCHVSIVTR